MELSQLFGDNRNESVINFCCQKCGIIMPEFELNIVKTLLRYNAKFCVFIGKRGATVFKIRERSKAAAHTVASAVRCHEAVIYFHDGAYRLVTPENVGETWRMIAPPPEKVRDERPEPRPQTPTMFEECRTKRPMKKMGKRGFSATAFANKVMSGYRTPKVRYICPVNP